MKALVRGKVSGNLALLALVLLVTQSTSAEVLTFDDLPEPDPFHPHPGAIPDGYGGLNWNSDIDWKDVPGQGAAYYNRNVMSGWGYYAGVVSPNRAAVTWFANDIVMEARTTPFTFNSAWFSAAAVGPVQPITVTIFQGQIPHSQTIALEYAKPQKFSFNVANVTKVVIDPGSYPITIDDITINAIMAPLDSDGDGVPDATDTFPYSRDVGANVRIGDCDTGVPSMLFPDGTTLSDLVYQIASEAKNHGQFARGVAELKNRFRNDSLLTPAQAAAIERCAARSGLP